MFHFKVRSGSHASDVDGLSYGPGSEHGDVCPSEFDLRKKFGDGNVRFELVRKETAVSVYEEPEPEPEFPEPNGLNITAHFPTAIAAGLFVFRKGTYYTITRDTFEPVCDPVKGKRAAEEVLLGYMDDEA